MSSLAIITEPLVCSWDDRRKRKYCTLTPQLSFDVQSMPYYSIVHLSLTDDVYATSLTKTQTIQNKPRQVRDNRLGALLHIADIPLD